MKRYKIGDVVKVTSTKLKGHFHNELYAYSVIPRKSKLIVSGLLGTPAAHYYLTAANTEVCWASVHAVHANTKKLPAT